MLNRFNKRHILTINISYKNELANMLNLGFIKFRVLTLKKKNIGGNLL